MLASRPCAPHAFAQGVIEQLRGDPVLRKVLDSPKMQRVLEEMQKDPAAAMQRHAGDRGVRARAALFGSHLLVYELRRPAGPA